MRRCGGLILNTPCPAGQGVFFETVTLDMKKERCKFILQRSFWENEIGCASTAQGLFRLS